MPGASLTTAPPGTGAAATDATGLAPLTTTEGKTAAVASAARIDVFSKIYPF
jgi:hypothetical protein